MSGFPPCTICGDTRHRTSQCKELGIPPEGFFKPSPGQHHCDEDDDEKARLLFVLNTLISIRNKPKRCF
jgi:hypothetical protein